MERRESPAKSMAGELGFEPKFSESESDVLPLNYSPIARRKWLFSKEKSTKRRENKGRSLVAFVTIRSR